MNVAVLMTCHNRKDKTIECLQHLYDQVGVRDLNLKVFLVDDGSTDGTGDAVRGAYPDVRVIQGDGSLFWNRGMCLAWDTAVADGQYDGYLWLNDDTMLYDNALATIEKIALQHPDSCVVATIESVKEKGKLTYGGLKKGVLQVSSELELNTCDTFNGNFVFIPKSVTERIGYLDPYFRHSVGDYDYSRRATRAGITSYVTPIIGSCERNPTEPNWNKGTLKQRFKKLYSPLGNNPFETFHTYKKDSLFKATYLFIYIHLRVLFTFILPKK